MIDPDFTPYVCLACGQHITDETGIALADDCEFNVCLTCWQTLTVRDRLDLARLWRLAKDQRATLQAFTDLCHAAMDGWHLPPGFSAHRGTN